MIKRFVLINSLIAVLATPLAWSQSHAFEALRGLERFNRSNFLSLDDTSQSVNTVLSIKGVKVGDNVLQQAINLDDQGGQLGNIRGGTVSKKIKFSFYQPYENTRLEQKVELYFDKHNGFIQQITGTYYLQDAYMSITPIRELTFSAAVEKFGLPLTMQQAYDVSGQENGDISLDDFINGLQDQLQLHPMGLEYFQKRNISRSSKWVKGEQDYALMHSGFDRCYLWQTNAYSQVLTFCYFDEAGANPDSRGIEFDLHNFPVEQHIKELGNSHSKLNLSL
ncbi:MAG: hypothetical protein ACJAV1_003886 [Paraglaciecola sp.]